MEFWERLAGRKKLFDFRVFLGDPQEAAVDILRSQSDTHWSEPVRLWASYVAFVSFAGKEAKIEAAAYAAALSERCRPGMLFANLVPTVVKPFLSVSGSFYSYRDSQRRIWVTTNVTLDGHRLVSVALFQWAFNSLAAISEAHIEFLGRVAWQLFCVLDDPEEMERVGGSFRLAQSAGDIAYLRALESTERRTSQNVEPVPKTEKPIRMTLDEVEEILHAYGDLLCEVDRPIISDESCLPATKDLSRRPWLLPSQPLAPTTSARVIAAHICFWHISSPALVRTA